MNFEVHSQLNNGFKITRPRTADLRDVSSVGFIQYYATGYVARPNRIYNLALAEIRGIDPVYEYTGKPIEPMFDVIANDGDALDRDIDYEVVYEDDHTETTDAAKLKVIGKDPWKGELTASFAIKVFISQNTHYIAGLPSEQVFDTPMGFSGLLPEYVFK